MSLSNDEIQSAIEAGELAYRDHQRKPRGTMMLPGDHDPTYWIARAVERAARAQVWREAVDSIVRCRYPVSTDIRPGGHDWDLSRLDEVVDDLLARAEKEQGNG